MILLSRPNIAALDLKGKRMSVKSEQKKPTQEQKEEEEGKKWWQKSNKWKTTKKNAAKSTSDKCGMNHWTPQPSTTVIIHAEESVAVFHFAII